MGVGGERIGGAVYELDLDSGDFDSKLRGAESRFDQAARRIDAAGQRISRAGRALTIGITAPMIAAGIGATKLAADFDTSLSKIVGLVGDSREAVAAFREEILELGPAVGRSPKELAEALYFVRSSGIAAADSMNVVKASAQGAAAGLGDTATVAQAVTSAMNAYGATNLSAAQATSILIATVREGKSEPAELANSIGRVIPIAAQLGVTFDQVGAALASMTLFGLDTEEAATALRGVFATLLKPSAQANEILEKVGLSAEGLRRQLREEGLLSVLTTLSTVLAGNEDALAAVIPNIRALTGFLSLAGKNADQVEGIFGSLAATTEQDLANAFDAASETVGFKFNQAMAQVQASAIRFGDTIAPIVTDVVLPALNRLLDVLEIMINIFQSLPSEVQLGIAVFLALAAAIGPALLAIGALASGVSALIALAPALLAAFSFLLAGGPLTIGIVGIAGLLAGLGATMLIMKSDTEQASDAALEFERTWLGVAKRVAEAIGRVERAILNVASVGLFQLTGDATGFEKIANSIDAARNQIEGEQLGRRSPELADIQKLAAGDGSALAKALGGIGQAATSATPELYDYGAGIDLTGDAAEEAAAKLDPLADGIIDLAEAIENELNPQQAAQLELMREDAVARFRLADALFRSEVETLKAADAGRTYVNALIEIQAEMIRSGRTADQFKRDITMDTLDAARTLASQILGRPTREGLELDLRAAELRRRRLLLLAGGADEDSPKVKAIDAELRSIQTAIDIRRAELDIIRIKTELADRTLDTDRDLINANIYLTAVINNLSGAAEIAVAALQDFAGIGTAPVAGTVAIPQYQHGTPYVPQTGPAWLHEGERVLPAGESGTPMHNGPIFEGRWTINATDEATIRRIADRQLSDGIAHARRTGTGGSRGIYRG